jgi:hypothetical protein
VLSQDLTPIILNMLSQDLTPVSFYIPYFIREQKILIVAIAHDRRKPGYWKARPHS